MKSGLIVSSIFFFSLFILFSIQVLAHNFYFVNMFFYTFLPYSAHSIFYHLSRIMAYLFIPLLVLLVFLLWRHHRRKQRVEALLLLSSFSGWVASELIFKPIFRIPCPPQVRGLAQEFHQLYKVSVVREIAKYETCYPSGHTTSYVVFFGYLAYLCFISFKPGLRRNVMVALNILAVALVGPSRLYLHVHWFADVVAGYFLGFALLSLTIYAHKRLLSSTS